TWMAYPLNDPRMKHLVVLMMESEHMIERSVLHHEHDEVFHAGIVERISHPGPSPLPTRTSGIASLEEPSPVPRTPENSQLWSLECRGTRTRCGYGRRSAW